MQLMWMTGPLGKLHTVSMRTRRVAISLAAVAGIFVATGVAVSVAAFRFAVDHDPALAASFGGMLTVSEAERRESAYRRTVDELRNEVAAAQRQLGQLQALKDEFARLASPRASRAAERKAKPGQGGPHIALDRGEAALLADHEAHDARHEHSDAARARFVELNRRLAQTQDDWRRELKRLQHVPTALPIADISGLSSRYGVRLDPFTQSPARHEGVDISAAAGTPIFATAAGVVARISTEGPYGKMVDIDHGNGYVTRYAHAAAIYVKPGQQLQRGATIGAVGSTGRSTAPHLHYEVRFHDEPQNPLDYGLQHD